MAKRKTVREWQREVSELQEQLKLAMKERDEAEQGHKTALATIASKHKLMQAAEARAEHAQEEARLVCELASSLAALVQSVVHRTEQIVAHRAEKPDASP